MWQTIDSAPRDGSRVLLFEAGGFMAEVCWGEWIGGEWRDIGDIGCNGQWGYEPTHWQPLPPPPDA